MATFFGSPPASAHGPVELHPLLDQESAVSSADIARVVDSSPEVTRRYCADMYGMGQIERVIVKGSGRPQHRYFNS